MIKKLKLDEFKGFSLLEIVIVVTLLGLLMMPMFQLLTSVLFSTSKENIKTDLGHKGRAALEKIFFDARDVPTTDYIEVYDESLVRKTTINDTGTSLKITDATKDPDTNNDADTWYRVYTDSGKKYLLKFDSNTGTIPSDWENYIFIDRVTSFNIQILDKAAVPNKLYDKYQINLDLEFGKSNKDKVHVSLNKQLIKYIAR